MTEIQEAIPTLESSADRLFLALLTSMPLRISELLGLRWEDVDVPNRMLHIHRRISYPMFGCSVISAPKNDASLQLSIPVTALTYLEEKGEGFVFGCKAPMLTRLSGICGNASISRSTCMERHITLSDTQYCCKVTSIERSSAKGHPPALYYPILASTLRSVPLHSNPNLLRGWHRSSCHPPFHRGDRT